MFKWLSKILIKWEEHRAKTRVPSIKNMERKWGYIMAFPAILGLILWKIGPMVASLFLSLTKWPIAGNPKYLGLENYSNLISNDPLFWKSLYVTTYYTLGSVPLLLLVAFIVALLLNQGVKGLALFRTIFYLPSVVPLVANSILWMWLFSPDFGILNAILSNFGLPKLMWIYSESQVIPSLILMSIWGMGNTMVIFLAGLQDVPVRLYEAIEIDGGNMWHKFRYVTIPMMSPVIFFNFVMGIIRSFQVFVQAYVMTEGGPNNASLFYVYNLFRNAFDYGKMGYASAMAWILFIIILILTGIIFKFSNNLVYYEGDRGR